MSSLSNRTLGRSQPQLIAVGKADTLGHKLRAQMIPHVDCNGYCIICVILVCEVIMESQEMNRQQEMKKVGGTPPFCIDVRNLKKPTGRR